MNRYPSDPSRGEPRRSAMPAHQAQSQRAYLTNPGGSPDRYDSPDLRQMLNKVPEVTVYF
jgi:hypothetical protein